MRNTFLWIGVMVMLAAPLAAQTVTVTAPNGGESWPQNTSHNITWNFTNAGSATVNITLRKGTISSSTKVGDIKTGWALSAGSWEWKFVGKLENGTMAAPGTDYLVRINIVGLNTRDESDQNFSITGAGGPAPTLQLLSPNGGESWTRGDPMNITWKAENWTGNVQLSLFKGGAYKGVIVPSVPSAPGTFAWEKVGTTNKGLADFGHDYRVSVSRVYSGPLTPYPGLRDQSDGDFSISALKIAGPLHTEKIKVAKTVSLTPSVSNKWHVKHRYTSRVLGYLDPRPDPMPLMRTGYENRYRKVPIGYWESWAYIYRGILKFDFSQIKGKVTEARLSMQCTGTDSTDGVPYCDGSVMVLDGPGDGFTNPSYHLVDLPAGGGPIANDVIKVSGPNIVITLTDLVNAWINDSQHNYGLLFLGNNETMDDESNDHCLSHFQASLSVTYIPAE